MAPPSPRRMGLTLVVAGFALFLAGAGATGLALTYGLSGRPLEGGVTWLLAGGVAAGVAGLSGLVVGARMVAEAQDAAHRETLEALRGKTIAVDAGEPRRLSLAPPRR